MYEKKLMLAVLLGILLCGTRLSAVAQDANTEPRPTAAKPAAPKPPLTAYRLDFSIEELEDGKKINTRHYSMHITTEGGPQTLKIGTRVPVLKEDGREFEYLDVGTSIFANLVSWQTPIGLEVSADVSSFAPSEKDKQSGAPGVIQGTPPPPLIRQLHIGGKTVLVLDKSMVIGSVDDPDSKHQFQLEVIATKLTP